MRDWILFIPRRYAHNDNSSSSYLEDVLFLVLNRLLNFVGLRVIDANRKSTKTLMS
jgi:hypothetical protein